MQSLVLLSALYRSRENFALSHRTKEKINTVILVQRAEYMYTTQTMQLKTPDVNSYMSQEPHVGITQHQQSINSMLQIESRSVSISE